MAIYYNGIKIVGRGIDGKSGKTAYETAKLGGYTGTEAEYNEQLVAIGDAVAGFNDLKEDVQEAEAKVQAATEQVNNKIIEFNTLVNNTNTQINNLVNEAIGDINEAKNDALNNIPNADTLATKDYVADAISQATSAIVTDIFYYGSSAPSNIKLLWIDSNSTTGGLKYHNGTSWVHVPVAWS